jgi:hypothetical protein
MALLDNSLLVYTSDNTLYHFLVIPTKETIKLHLCGSISFQGILQVPSRVRALSWMIPQAQKGTFLYLLLLFSLLFILTLSRWTGLQAMSEEDS